MKNRKDEALRHAGHTYEIQHLGDLLNIPPARRALALDYMLKWLNDPRTTFPKPGLFSFHLWFGGALPTFRWTDPGAPSPAGQGYLPEPEKGPGEPEGFNPYSALALASKATKLSPRQAGSLSSARMLYDYGTPAHPLKGRDTHPLRAQIDAVLVPLWEKTLPVLAAVDLLLALVPEAEAALAEQAARDELAKLLAEGGIERLDGPGGTGSTFIIPGRLYNGGEEEATRVELFVVPNTALLVLRELKKALAGAPYDTLTVYRRNLAMAGVALKRTGHFDDAWEATVPGAGGYQEKLNGKTEFAAAREAVAKFVYFPASEKRGSMKANLDAAVKEELVKATKPGGILDAEHIRRAQAGIDKLVAEFGLTVVPGNGCTHYYAPPRLGAPEGTKELHTPVATGDVQTALKEVEAWLRQHAGGLDTVSTLERRLATQYAGKVLEPTNDNRWYRLVVDQCGFAPVLLLESRNLFWATREALEYMVKKNNPVPGARPEGIGQTVRVPHEVTGGIGELLSMQTYAVQDSILGAEAAARWRAGKCKVMMLVQQPDAADGTVLRQKLLALPGAWEARPEPRVIDGKVYYKLMCLDLKGDATPGLHGHDLGVVDADAAGELRALKEAVRLLCEQKYMPPAYGGIVAFRAALDAAGLLPTVVYGETKVGKTPLETLREFVGIQGNSGNWNYSAYMLGMFNGLELAVATHEDREPAYRKMPAEGWLEDKRGSKAPENSPVCGYDPEKHSAPVPHPGPFPGIAKPGESLLTPEQLDTVRLKQQMRCVKHWTLDPELVDDGQGGKAPRSEIAEGTVVPLSGWDWQKQTATLLSGLVVSLADLWEHCRPVKHNMPESYSGAVLLSETTPATTVLDPEPLSAPFPEATDIRLGGVPLTPENFSTTPNPETVAMLEGMGGNALRFPDHPVVPHQEATFEEVDAVRPAPTGEPVTELPPTPASEGQQALEAAVPDAPGLFGKDAPRVWVFLSDVLGQFARFAVCQSPYLHPDGLLEVLDAVKAEIQGRFDPELGWAELNRVDLLEMLSEATAMCEQFSAWNQRKNGDTSPFAFTSRYDKKPDPDSDFIDLGALLGNVARACTESHPDDGATLVASQQPPQLPGGDGGLWRYRDDVKGGKYLVVRRDGTVLEHLHFVLVARDLAAVHAMGAYAWYAALLKYPPQFVADCERFAREMAEYRKTHGSGNPCAGPERPDDPAVVARMVGETPPDQRSGVMVD